MNGSINNEEALHLAVRSGNVRSVAELLKRCVLIIEHSVYILKYLKLYQFVKTTSKGIYFNAAITAQTFITA